MSQNRKSLKPVESANRSLRQHLGLRGELTLALFPTLTVLGVFAFVEVLSQQRLLFASLASSAFLIYLDPQHGMNSVRTLIVSQLLAVSLGFGANLLFGSTYLAGGSAMAVTIVLLIVFDAVHPPAVSTALSFALRPGNDSNLLLFVLALVITVLLVGLERVALWLLARSVHSSGGKKS